MRLYEISYSMADGDFYHELTVGNSAKEVYDEFMAKSDETINEIIDPVYVDEVVIDGYQITLIEDPSVSDKVADFYPTIELLEKWEKEAADARQEMWDKIRASRLEDEAVR